MMFMRTIKIYIFLTLCCLSTAFAAETEISGVVRDSVTRETLPYVAVYFKNTTRGTTTDLYGKYSILTKEPGVLVFSMMGYKDYKVNVKADGVKRNIKVNLAPDVYSLNEVVVNPKI